MDHTIPGRGSDLVPIKKKKINSNQRDFAVPVDYRVKMPKKKKKKKWKDGQIPGSCQRAKTWETRRW